MILAGKHHRMKLLVLTLLLTLIPVTQAQEFEPDPRIQAAMEQGLFTPIDQSQTVDAVTVTVENVYVDTQQLILGYTITGADPLLYGNPFQTPITLRDQNGAAFSYASAQVNPAGNGDSNRFLVTFYNQAVIEGENSAVAVVDDYFRTNFDTVPESINLQLEINYDDFVIEEWLPLDLESSDHQPGDTVEGVGPFVFDFSAPVYPALELQPMQSVTANDLEITLEALNITPLTGEARICYDLPDERDWQPEISVALDDQPGRMTGHGTTDMAQFENTERRCRDIRFDLFYSGQAEHVALSLDYLTTSMREGPEDWERIETVLAEAGIDIDVIFEQGENGGGGIRIEEVDVPEGFDLQAAMNSARETLGDRIAGPWIFEVELPG